MTRVSAYRLASVALALLAVVLLTSGPKYISWLIADFAATWAFLGCLLYLAGRGRRDRIVGTTALCIAIPLHNAYGVVVLVGVALALGTVLISRRLPHARRPLLWLLGIGLAANIATSVATKLLMAANPPAERRATSTFVLNRLHADGLLVPFLDEMCPQRSWNLCRSVDDLRHHPDPNWFLWKWGGPARRDRGWDTPETDEILTELMLNHPWPVALTSVLGTWAQLWTIDSSEGLDRTLDVVLTASALLAHARPQIQSLVDSRQRHQKACATVFGIDERLVFVPSVLFMVASLVLAGFRPSALATPTVSVFGGILLLLVINAAVSAFSSGVFGRYQGRVAWVAVYFVVLFVADSPRMVGMAFSRRPD